MIDGADFDVVILAVLGVVAAVLVAGLVIGVATRRLAGCPAPIAIGVGIVSAVTLVVDGVVLARALAGEVTSWDLVWALGLTTASVFAWQGLRTRVGRGPSTTSE